MAARCWLPFFGRPVVPSAYGQRFAYGHIREEGRDLIVSAGLGCSIMPVRFGVPPEITVVTLRLPSLTPAMAEAQARAHAASKSP